jgi:hypothetical protein
VHGPEAARLAAEREEGLFHAGKANGHRTEGTEQCGILRQPAERGVDRPAFPRGHAAHLDLAADEHVGRERAARAVFQARHDHPPADRGAPRRGLENVGRAGRGVDKEVRAALAGGFEHGGRPVAAVGVNDQVGTELRRRAEPRPVAGPADRCHRSRAAPAGGGHRCQAMLAHAEHDHRLSRLEPARGTQPRQAIGDGDEQGREARVEGFGHGVRRRARRQVRVTREPAPQRGRDVEGGTAVARRPRAHPVPPAAALRARPAGQRLLDRDPRAWLEGRVPVVAPCCDDAPDHFMAGDERRRDVALGVPAPVTAADPARLHLEPGAGGGQRARRDRPHLDRPWRGQHGRRALLHDRAHGAVRRAGSR